MTLYKILHADDEESTLELVSMMLTARANKKPYRVEYTPVLTAEEFRSRYDEAFHIRVIDNNLESVDIGYETMIEIARKKSLKGINLMHSSSLEDAQTEELERNGIHHVEKPDPANLVNKIVSILDEIDASTAKSL